MFAEKYVILTTPERSGIVEASRSRAGSMHEVEVAELNPSEVQELQQDPRKELAPSMPWTLIEPISSEAEDVTSEGVVSWGIEAISATTSPFDGSGIIVAILDTGIALDHPAFTGVDVQRRNFTSESDNDTNGHGTHCAGTIFGQDVDGVRIGIAHNVKKALIGKVLGKGGSTESIVKAINWAVNEGANVVSMSFRLDFQGYVSYLIEHQGLDRDPATSMALEAYRKNVNLYTSVYRSVLDLRVFGDGIVFVAASGNESRRPKYEIASSPPAAARDIISVGALAKGKNGYAVADFSNSQVDISAPGVDIISAKVGGGFTSMSGTSMATPHVAGVAALWAQRQMETDSRINSDRLEMQLKASGMQTMLDPDRYTPESVGSGIVQAPLD